MARPPLNLALLVSGNGTSLQNLIDEIAAARLNAKIVRVCASRAGIKAIDRARAAGLPAVVASADQVFHDCDAAHVDLICLAGWLSLLPIPRRWVGSVMNIHPALLPSFGGKGFYGMKVHEAVLAHGCKVSGCTVHFVDDRYDSGPIILQRACPVAEDDTPQTLAARVFEQEKIAYPRAIQLFHEQRLRIEGRIVKVLEANVEC
jgi:phosphoribosylglycinamide formyltransferase-1